jgi:short-subunit dehydrogenase
MVDVAVNEGDEAAAARSLLQAGQHALVTGAGSGIGRAIALALAAEGVRLTLVGRDAAKLQAVAARAGAGTVSVAADLATEEGIETVSSAAGAGLDLLVHSAGVFGARGPIGLLSIAEWQRLDAVNLYAPMRLTAACLDRLKAAGGQIVVVNSTAVFNAAPNAAAYAAAKHALRAMTDALRQEVNAFGIRVLSVFPGRTDTPMQAGILAAEGRIAAAGALMRPEDVALMVIAALKLPATAEVTEIVMRAMRPL